MKKILEYLNQNSQLKITEEDNLVINKKLQTAGKMPLNLK